jgi:hypothetical protein
LKRGFLDIVAVGATPTGDGIINIPGTNGTGIFAVATTNLGDDGFVVVSSNTHPLSLPANGFICGTNPTTGQCITPLAQSITRTVGIQETQTFSVFVFGSGSVPFDPAINRISVDFRNINPNDPNDHGILVGRTSAAVRTQ